MRRFTHWTVTLLVVVTGFLTTGCYDRQELEQQAFVTVIGLDKAPNNLLDCTLQIATPTTNSSSGSGKEPLAAKGPVTLRAKSLAEALMLANTSVERTITLSHLSVVVFGEDLAKQGLEPVIQPFTRYRQFRRTMFVAVAKGQARDIMTADQPMLEDSPNRMADSIYVMGSRVGLFPVTQLNDVITALESPHQDVLLPMYSVNQAVKSGQGDQGVTETKESSEPGQVARSGGNPVEWIGGALLRGDKMVDTLSGNEMLYLRMLRGTLQSTHIDFSMHKNQAESVGLYLRKERSPDIKVRLTRPPKVSVTLSFDADLMTEPKAGSAGTTIARERKLEQFAESKLEQNITDLLNKIYRKDGVDPVPLSNQIRHQFPTFSAFANYPWENQLQGLTSHVTVDLQIRRFGKRLAPLRES